MRMPQRASRDIEEMFQTAYSNRNLMATAKSKPPHGTSGPTTHKGAIMGLLDALTSIAGGASPEHHGVADALSQVMQEHPGGMDGILNQLKQNGLGEQVQSWVSPGENKAISPDQVQQGFGQSMMENIAQRAGISPAVASGVIAVVLPLVVSHLSGNSGQPTQQSGLAGLASKIFGA
jgi:uncharacterized protein YidB (DUF937 family)